MTTMGSTNSPSNFSINQFSYEKSENTSQETTNSYNQIIYNQHSFDSSNNQRMEMNSLGMKNLSMKSMEIHNSNPTRVSPNIVSPALETMCNDFEDVEDNSTTATTNSPSTSYGPNNSSKNPSESNSPNYSGLNSSLDTLKKEINQVKESIIFAVSKMNMCDVPLRRQVFESMINKQAEQLSTAKRMPGYKEFLEIEKCKTLYPIENERLEELKKACLLLRNPYEQIVNTNTHHLTDAVQVTEAAIRRLIQMSNKLSSFNRLSQSDKIALLKSSIIEMFCIRATTNFNVENNFWYFIDDQNKGLSLVSMEVLTAAQINFLSHKEFAIKYQSEFRNDNVIADLLTAIILFRPSRATISVPDIVHEEFLNYCYLLNRYLHVKHDGDSCAAKTSFITLMHRLEELFHLSEDIVRIYMDLNPQNAGQLFVELFDLS
ncbi:nuclear hormone receptor HR96 [Dermatophagoides farinae]|uniref:nuclear hormone receptor HR96 n=1 Tax=Dermatophagoides farinae TaxID=6954 RepID=UPI003F60D88A